jgi:hypothetical protein
MRLWSLHPQYLDRQGLLACWREALGAQAVLAGRVAGYSHHPQLERFLGRYQVKYIGWYLYLLRQEGLMRLTKKGRPMELKQDKILEIASYDFDPPITVSLGQLLYEKKHLMAKIEARRGKARVDLPVHDLPLVHPLFSIRFEDLNTEPWERLHV